MERPYELVVLLHPDLEIDLDAPTKKIERLITEAGGKITARDNWGKKRLAYRIRKQDFAIYLYFELELKPEQVHTLESTLLITEEVLRHLLVSHEEAPATQTNGAKRPAEDKAAEPVAEEV